jgi:hypothetical protein
MPERQDWYPLEAVFVQVRKIDLRLQKLQVIRQFGVIVRFHEFD